MKGHILYNPIAGNGAKEEQVKALSEWFEGELSYREIHEISSYKEFFASIPEEDTVILCGGDGTLNRFVNDTEALDVKNEILYFASGSGNDFLRDLEKKAEDGPFSIKDYIKDLPMVEVKGKRYRFLNNVGFGIDGYCCEVGDAQRAASDKPVNYTAIAIKGLLFHYKPTAATVTVDGVEYRYKRVWLAPTMKGRFYGGGMMAAPAQDRKDPDGKLSVMLFYGKGRLRTLIAFPSIFKGEHINHRKMVKIHEGRDITVTFDRPAPVQIDGETILDVTSYRAVARAEALVNA